MAALTTVAVTARTTSGCTITFNAASIDVNTAQVKQLRALFQRLSLDTTGTESAGTSAAITIGAQG